MTNSWEQNKIRAEIAASKEPTTGVKSNGSVYAHFWKWLIVIVVIAGFFGGNDRHRFQNDVATGATANAVESAWFVQCCMLVVLGIIAWQLVNISRIMSAKRNP